jgi:hypothetical protein
MKKKNIKFSILTLNGVLAVGVLLGGAVTSNAVADTLPSGIDQVTADAAASFGLSPQQAVDLASHFGLTPQQVFNQMVSHGITREQAATIIAQAQAQVLAQRQVGTLAPSAIAAPGAPLPVSSLASLSSHGIVGVGNLSVNRIDELVNVMGLFTVERLAAGYLMQQNLQASINFRGVVGYVTVDPRNMSFRVTVPAAHIDRTFQGTSVANASLQFTNSLKSDGGSMIRSMLRSAVATTTVDPVAGNPMSLIGRMVSNDMGAAARGFGMNPDSEWNARGWRVYGGVRGGRYEGQPSGGVTTKQISGGVSYDLSPGGWGMFMDSNMAVRDTYGQDHALAGQMALGVRIPVYRSADDDLRWSLVPQVRAGATGSMAVGSGGVALGYSLTSNLQARILGDLSITLANAVGRYQTEPLKFGSYEYDYGITNTIFRNGVSVSRPLGEYFDRQINVGFFVADNRVAGDRWSVRNWQEMGLHATIGQTSPVKVSLTGHNGERGVRGIILGLSSAFSL